MKTSGIRRVVGYGIFFSILHALCCSMVFLVYERHDWLAQTLLFPIWWSFNKILFLIRDALPAPFGDRYYGFRIPMYCGAFALNSLFWGFGLSAGLFRCWKKVTRKASEE